MGSPQDPNFCAVCGEGLFEEGPNGTPQRIGEVFLVGGDDVIDQMVGTQDEKWDAKQAFSIKAGFCPDCLDEYDIEKDETENLSDAYEEIKLSRTTEVPERDLP